MRDTRYEKGFTLIELMTTITAALIIVLGVGITIVDSHRGWHRLYNRVQGDVVTDSYVARNTFDAVVRKSSIKRCELGNSGEFVEVYYYQDPNSLELDGYARFYISGEQLLVVYGDGTIDAGGSWVATSASTPVMLAHNVKSCRFSVDGTCVQMILSLDNGSETMTVSTSAVRHNI